MRAALAQPMSFRRVANGLLAGASLDQSIEQLPARHRIGDRAYSAYSRASHRANGRFWLVPLGIGGPLLTIAAAFRRDPASLLAAGLAVAHMLSTVKAASVNLTQWRADVDDAALREILNRFERWQALRASLQLLTFVASALALAGTRDGDNQLFVLGSEFGDYFGFHCTLCPCSRLGTRSRGPSPSSTTSPRAFQSWIQSFKSLSQTNGCVTAERQRSSYNTIPLSLNNFKMLAFDAARWRLRRFICAIDGWSPSSGSKVVCPDRASSFRALAPARALAITGCILFSTSLKTSNPLS